MTMAASVNALPRCSLCRFAISVEEQLPE
jgi:hypothetical protein